MKTILIGTTSVNRPALHENNIPDWYIWINSLDKKKYDIRWFINIDMIEKLNFTYDETKTNYETIIKDIPITFLQHPEGKGNFLKACQRVSQTIENHVVNNNLNKDDVIIFWLEDDWKLNKKVLLDLNRIIEMYMLTMCHINLSFVRANYIHALAPGLINYKLWEKLHLYAWKQIKDNIDPEHGLGIYAKNTVCGEFDDMFNLTIINKYKKPTEDFFNSKFLNNTNSYYTYDIDETINIIKNNYIDKNKINTFFKDKPTFIRITCGCSNDIGRSFMKKYNLEKKIINDKNNEDINNSVIKENHFENLNNKKKFPCIIYVQTKYENFTFNQIEEINSSYETHFFLRETANKIINEKIHYYNTKDFDFSLIKDIVIKEYLPNEKCKCGSKGIKTKKCCAVPKVIKNLLKQFFKKYENKLIARTIIKNIYDKYHTRIDEMWKKLFQLYNVPKNERKYYLPCPENFIYKWLTKKKQYFIYLNDTVTIKNIDKTIQECLCIFRYHKKSKDIFTLNKDIDQIIFYNKKLDDISEKLIRCNFRHKNDNMISYYIPEIKNILLDNFHIFELIKDVISINNPYTKTKSININYKDYVTKNYPQNNMKLLPGIIDTSNFIFEYYSNKKQYDITFKNNKFSENFFSEYYENNTFKTVYADTNIEKNITNCNTIHNNKKIDKDVTIVTAFLNINLKRKPKHGCESYNYIEKSNGTLSIDQNMVIYVSEDLIKFVTKFRKDKGLLHKTKIIEINIEEHLYLYKNIDKVRVNVKKNIEPYNLAEYILAVNSRYGYLKSAIKNNYFKTDYFMWIDFSAGHIIDMNFPNKEILINNDDIVRIAWISRIDKDLPYFHFRFNHECLGGGLFLGHKNALLNLIDLHDIEFKKLMNMGYHINDDKLLFLIYLKYPTLFDIYNCGYNKVYELL